MHAVGFHVGDVSDFGYYGFGVGWIVGLDIEGGCSANSAIKFLQFGKRKKHTRALAMGNNSRNTKRLIKQLNGVAQLRMIPIGIDIVDENVIVGPEGAALQIGKWM